MDFMVKRLIRMSMTFRKLAFSQAQHVNISKLCNTSQFHKDKGCHSDLEHSKEDLMLITLQQGLSPSKLLNYMDSNKNNIKHVHVLAALSSLHNFYQDKLHSSINLHEQVDFVKLCISLKPQIKQLTPEEVIKALNILQLLKIPSCNIFITTLLHHIHDLINELSFQEIYKLSNVLDKFIPTTLSKSIELDTRNQFSKKIPNLDKNDVTSLIYALCFASKNIRDKPTVNFLIDSIEKYKKNIRFPEALTILNSFYSIKDLPYILKKILQQIQRIIVDNIDELKPDQILWILKEISIKINANCEEFYNEEFIDRLVEKVIYENWNFIQGNSILSFLNDIGHVQIDLLDYLSAKYYEDPNILNLKLDLLQPLIKGLALADYKPVFWDVIKEPILNNEISNFEHLRLCYFTLYLACLECFEPRFLQDIFSVKHIISEEHQTILLRLYQIVKVLYPVYNGPWPSKHLLTCFKNLHQNKNQDYPLLSALEQAFGGNECIKTNIRTKLEHYIDHVVIMNRAGYPIAVNSCRSIESDWKNYDITYLEDLAIPPGSQIFIILHVQPEWYARNTQRMLGPYSLFIKTLELMSYTVIPVNGKMWQKMSDNEKIFYIMQAIKLKFEDDSISTTS